MRSIDRLNLGKTLTYVRNLKPGNHGIFFYENPQEKREVLFSFLQAGLERGEGAIYVAAEEPSAHIRRHMEAFGLDVQSLYKDGLLRIFDYDDWYIIDGKVNIPYMTRLGHYVFQQAMDLGLKGLRGCGETACFFEHQKVKELVDYELMIGRRFDLPLTSLCAYDVTHAKSLEDRFFLGLIKAHGSVVTASFAQEVKFEKLFPTILDKVLEDLFGEMGKETILRILEERYSLELQKIVEDPTSFIHGLEELVDSGAQVITKSVVAQIHSKIGIIQHK